MTEDDFIERRIVTGLIVSTDYIREVSQTWDPRLLGSPDARLLAEWCLEHYNKYHVAPGRHIQDIYTGKLKDGLDKEQAEDIEGILNGLSDEYDLEHFNVPYLLDQTRRYFQEQHLQNFVEELQGELSRGSLVDAERLASAYAPIAKGEIDVVDPFKDSEGMWQAFEDREKPLIQFPEALDRFWGSQFTRDSLVGIMGPEKSGKSFMLKEIAVRAKASGCSTAVFQAGDMSKKQWIRRLGIYLTKRSDDSQYCQGIWIPQLDCLWQQMGKCDSKKRECDFGPFEGKDWEELQRLTYDDRVTAAKKYDDYAPCKNCNKIKGTVWLRWREPVKPLTWKEAAKEARKFRRLFRAPFKLSTHANETLSPGQIVALLDTWERQDNFVPDVIIIDYADLLAPDSDLVRLDERGRQNKIWQRLRRLSQERRCLVVTATQAAATSYGKKTLTLHDFSEDKRKYAHVTAMFGLNRTEQEELTGLQRLNALVVRDDKRPAPVTLLQRLEMGRPYLGSFR
jgi:hypothetical protein